MNTLTRIGLSGTIVLLFLNGTAHARPTAIVEVEPPRGVSQEFEKEMDNFAAHVRMALDSGGGFSIVDRDEIFALTEEREFSQAFSAPGEQIQDGKDAPAQFLIRVQVGRFEKTDIQRGRLHTEYRGLATARVVDTSRGTSEVSVSAQLPDRSFFRNDTEAVIALAETLSTEIASAVRPSAEGSVASQGVQNPSAMASGALNEILRIRQDGSLFLSNEGDALSVGDQLQIYIREEFEDPRNPGQMLLDEIPVGKIEVERVISSGVIARSLSPDADFEVLMAARKINQHAGTGLARRGEQSLREARPDAGPAKDHRADLLRGRDQDAVRPTLHIGRFVYSNEFDLSQTEDRHGRSGAGDASGATAGALIGGLATGGPAREWIGGAVAGALGGNVVDQERQREEERRKAERERKRNEQELTALERESPVLREMVLTKAHSSQRFQVIEDLTSGGDRRPEIEAQMVLEEDGSFDIDRVVQRGRLQGARYSAFGTILRFETNRIQRGRGPLGGRRDVEMIMTLALRLVDNETGQIVISDQISGAIHTEASQMSFLGFGTSRENDGAIGQLLDVLARNIISKISTTLYPIQIIDVNADQRMVRINAGETIVSSGERMNVFRVGAEIRDPYSGTVLGREEEEAGVIEIVETQAMFSRGRIIRPAGDISDVINSGYYCRPIVQQASADQPAQRSRGGF